MDNTDDPRSQQWGPSAPAITAVARLVQDVSTTEQRLDALVCNAGFMIRKPIRELTLPEWSLVLGTNLTSTFLLARGFETLLRAAHGAIVTVASTRARPTWSLATPAPT